jgi:hypothetical protein
MHAGKIYFIAALLLTSACGVQANALSLPEDRTSDAQTGTWDARPPMPTRGLSMQQVQARFGEPLSKRSAVGEPPITRWSYPGYTVYFEHQYVIHSVIKQR